MQHQIPYRGYNIKTERRDLCWTFTVEPTRPELPVLEDQPFRTLTQSERLAVAQARQKVDHALDAWKSLPAIGAELANGGKNDHFTCDEAYRSE